MNIGLNTPLVTALAISLTMVAIALWLLVSARRNQKGDK